MFEKIEYESVVSTVVNKIKSSIMNGDLRPGDKLLTEVELIELLGVGRNSVREVVKMLAALGVLEVQRGQGTFVVQKVKPSFFTPLLFSLIIEPKANRDLYELRVMFDTMVLFCAIDKISEEQIKTLKMMIEMVESKYLEKDDIINMEYYIHQDITFHKYLLETTRNPLIQRIGHSILEFIPEYVKRSIQQDHGVERSIRDHKEIMTKSVDQFMRLLKSGRCVGDGGAK